MDQAVETYGLQKITLLREISLKTGIQVGTSHSVLAGPQPTFCGQAHSVEEEGGFGVVITGHIIVG